MRLIAPAMECHVVMGAPRTWCEHYAVMAVCVVAYTRLLHGDTASTLSAA